MNGLHITVSTDLLTAGQALHALNAGNITAMDLVRQCHARIDTINPVVHAVVTEDRTAALAGAYIQDVLRAGAGSPGALSGLPITIKDSFATQGLRTTSSFAPLAQHVPTADAAVVGRLRAAGAVVLGKTNLPELAGDVQCWSPLFGPTHNPWRLNHTPGGSSGGSAAAVATGLSFMDLGSDLAGSIRIPAAYCGVAGLKATEGSLPVEGHIPPLPGSPRTVWHMLSLGLLARCVDDLALGFDALVAPNVTTTQPAPLGRPLRVAWWDDFVGLPLCPRTRAALDATVRALTQAGATVQRMRPATFDVPTAWAAFGHVAGAEIGLGLPTMARWAAASAGKSLGFLMAASGMPLTRAIAQGMALDRRRYNHGLNQRARLIAALDSFLTEWDVWLCPVAAITAYVARPPGRWPASPWLRVGQRRIPRLEATLGMTVPFSLTGHPVVSLPVGIYDGLPVGLQIVGARSEEHRLLACAGMLEGLLRHA
jgi:amidase